MRGTGEAVKIDRATGADLGSFCRFGIYRFPAESMLSCHPRKSDAVPRRHSSAGASAQAVLAATGSGSGSHHHPEEGWQHCPRPRDHHSSVAAVLAGRQRLTTGWSTPLNLFQLPTGNTCWRSCWPPCPQLLLSTRGDGRIPFLTPSGLKQGPGLWAGRGGGPGPCPQGHRGCEHPERTDAVWHQHSDQTPEASGVD